MKMVFGMGILPQTLFFSINGIASISPRSKPSNMWKKFQSIDWRWMEVHFSNKIILLE